MRPLRPILTSSLLLLAGCVTAPAPIPASHPASPAAEESQTPLARPLLGLDHDSRQTQTLLDERARPAAVEYTPPAATPALPSPMDHSAMPMGL